MAEMIPDRLPSNSSRGEQKLFSVLQKLPDDHIVYYESSINDRYPDFIVIYPNFGLQVIEVKGWYAKNIVSGDLHNVTVLDQRSKRKETQKHPIRQAREYMYGLMDECRKHPQSQSLLHQDGKNLNRFIFPFSHFALLSNATTSQLINHPNGDLTTIFPAKRVATRDQLDEWLDESFSSEQLIQVLHSFFDPVWSIEPMNTDQINTIRAVLHPEIILSEPNALAESASTIFKTYPDLKVLDLRQENNAKNIGDGHRIIYGVAGSGKTVLLISRAKLISDQQPSAQILLLCYNVTLAAYLRKTLSNYPNVNVVHFDGWAKDNGLVRQRDESNRELGDRFLNVLEQGKGDSGKYDVVMIDEAQDFESSWFKCVLEAMQEPLDGDLLIVGDGSQGLYPRGQLSWKAIGIKAKGRTYYTKFDLDKNYRNSREIVKLASIFASQSKEDTDTIISIQVDPNKCIRSTGIKPVLVKSNNKEKEIDQVFSIVKDLLKGEWFGQNVEPLKPENIGIFYSALYKKNRPILESLIERLSAIAPTVWLTNSQDRAARSLISEPGIKIQTIHSAKGLQYQAVIILWANLLPSPFEESDEQKDRRIFYVGLTRPEDFLLISAYDNSEFIEEIEQSDSVDVIDISPDNFQKDNVDPIDICF